MINFKVKNIPTDFVEIAGKDFKINSVFNTLEAVQLTGIALDCNVTTAVAEALVQEGLLEGIICKGLDAYKTTDKFDRYYFEFKAEYYKRKGLRYV